MIIITSSSNSIRIRVSSVVVVVPNGLIGGPCVFPLFGGLLGGHYFTRTTANPPQVLINEQRCTPNYCVFPLLYTNYCEPPQILINEQRCTANKKNTTKDAGQLNRAVTY